MAGAVDVRFRALRFDSHCVNMLGKLPIPCCLCSPSSDVYPVDCERLCLGGSSYSLHTCMTGAMYSPCRDDIGQVQKCVPIPGKSQVS